MVQILLVALIGYVCTQQIPTDHNVLVIDDSSINLAIHRYNYLLLEFYSPM